VEVAETVAFFDFFCLFWQILSFWLFILSFLASFGLLFFGFFLEIFGFCGKFGISCSLHRGYGTWHAV
jgi:hypothetical protein